jgi:hypothetical protein
LSKELPGENAREFPGLSSKTRRGFTIHVPRQDPRFAVKPVFSIVREWVIAMEMILSRDFDAVVPAVCPLFE